MTGSNVGATKETGEPTVAVVAAERPSWWTWTAASSGPVHADGLRAVRLILRWVSIAAQRSMP